MDFGSGVQICYGTALRFQCSYQIFVSFSVARVFDAVNTCVYHYIPVGAYVLRSWYFINMHCFNGFTREPGPSVPSTEPKFTFRPFESTMRAVLLALCGFMSLK